MAYNFRSGSGVPRTLSAPQASTSKTTRGKGKARAVETSSQPTPEPSLPAEDDDHPFEPRTPTQEAEETLRAEVNPPFSPIIEEPTAEAAETERLLVEDPTGNQEEPDQQPEADPTALHPDSEDEMQATIKNLVLQAQMSEMRKMMRLFASSNRSTPKEPKVKEPDTFSGTDYSKFNPFIAQCRLVFVSQPSRFQTEASKVFYAASYLSDIAGLWFQPMLSIPRTEYPIWLTNFDEFEKELGRMFGDPNYLRNSEQKLRKLVMKEHYKVARYTAEFSRLSNITEWNDKALYSQYYEGLPARIKDELIHFPEPRDLRSLQHLAQQIDNRYWAREDQKKTGASTPDRKRKRNPNGQPNNQPNRTPPNPSNPPKPITNPPKPTSTPKTTGPDGKLLPSERERRQKAGLCLYCGKGGHGVANCPKKTPTSLPKSVGARGTTETQSGNSSAPQ